MSRGTTTRNVRIDDDRWQALGEIAEAAETDRSAMIRAWIDSLREVTGSHPASDAQPQGAGDRA